MFCKEMIFEMRKSVLGNGLTVFTQQTSSEFVTVNVSVNAGAANEPDGKRGVAHLAEHMLFKGTTTRSAADVNYALKPYGGYTNAYTAQFSTVYNCTILSEYIVNAVELLADMIYNNTIPADEFDRERNVVCEEMKMYNDLPNSRCYDLVTSTVFANYPNRMNVGGTVETVSKLAREDVVAFVDTNYVPTNMTVFIVGDVDHDVAVAIVNEHMGGYQLTDAISSRAQIDVDKLVVADVSDEMNVSQDTMTMYTLKMTTPTLRDMLLQSLSEGILGSDLGSRLGKVREEYGYCYSIGLSIDTFDQLEIAMITLSLNEANVENAQVVIREIVNEAVLNGVTEDEFKCAKVNTISEVKKLFETPWDATRLVMRLGEFGLYVDLQAYEDELEKITIDDVNNYLKAILGGELAVAIVKSK